MSTFFNVVIVVVVISLVFSGLLVLWLATAAEIQRYRAIRDRRDER